LVLVYLLTSEYLQLRFAVAAVRELPARVYCHAAHFFDSSQRIWYVGRRTVFTRVTLTSLHWPTAYKCSG